MLEKYTKWLSDNREAINLSYVANSIGMDVSNLHRAINGQRDSHGCIAKIPKRCEIPLRDFLEKIGVDPSRIF